MKLVSPKSSMITDTLIIGAGIAGLAAAARLRAAGQSVIVLEKSRGLGGRAATRRWEGLPVDHGAQFFTARSPEFRARVDDWIARGVCFMWADGFHEFLDGVLAAPGPGAHPRHACTNGMSSLARDLAGPDPGFILRETSATSVEACGGGWRVVCGGGRAFEARALVVTAPLPQATGLLGGAAGVPDVPMDPCFALAARWPRRDIAWRGIHLRNHPVLSWVGHDTSKRPGLHPDTTVLVLHAAADFTRGHYDMPHGEVAEHMLAAASDITGGDFTRPESFFVHRWRYAQPADPASAAAPVTNLGAHAPLLLAGDGTSGGKIEGAWLSGRAAARSIMERAGF